jgi:hypothetical protein
MVQLRGSLVFIGLVALTGCGNGLVKLDAETVNERLDWLSASLPMCQTPAAGTPPALPSDWRSDGSCGGTLTNLSEHDNGVTDIDLTFAAYCLQTDNGPVILDGVMKAKEIGQPTDYGPMISAFELDGDGPITVTRDSGTMEVEYGHSRTTYGTPSTFSPGEPTSDSPDRTEISRISFTYPDRVDFFEGLVFERTSGWPATLHIRDGVAGTEGGGAMRLATPEADPLVFNVGTPFITSGSVVMTGKGGSEVTIVPDAATNLRFDLLLDGVPFERTVDCGTAQGPAIEFMTALMIELPIP